MQSQGIQGMTKNATNIVLVHGVWADTSPNTEINLRSFKAPDVLQSYIGYTDTIFKKITEPIYQQGSNPTEPVLILKLIQICNVKSRKNVKV